MNVFSVFMSIVGLLLFVCCCSCWCQVLGEWREVSQCCHFMSRDSHALYHYHDLWTICVEERVCCACVVQSASVCVHVAVSILHGRQLPLLWWSLQVFPWSSGTSLYTQTCAGTQLWVRTLPDLLFVYEILYLNKIQWCCISWGTYLIGWLCCVCVCVCACSLLRVGGKCLARSVEDNIWSSAILRWERASNRWSMCMCVYVR